MNDKLILKYLISECHSVHSVTDGAFSTTKLKLHTTVAQAITQLIPDKNSTKYKKLYRRVLALTNTGLDIITAIKLAMKEDK